MKNKLFLFGIVLLLVSCENSGNQTTTQFGTDTVSDDYGRTVVVPNHPQRVVSTSPAVTEILFALGAEKLLVGRTDFCTYPAEAANIPSIGGISDLNVERILLLEPDLVISGSMVSKKITDQLDAMGIPIVCIIEKPKFEALYDNITAIGKLVDKKHEADSLNALLHNRVSQLNTEHLTQNTKSCYYVVGFGAGGNFTAGGNTFINDIIRMAGGRNIAENVTGWSYSQEALVTEDPDYIIVRREDSAVFCNMMPYNRLSAVRKGHVIGIESGIMDLQVPRNIDAIVYLQKRMNNQETVMEQSSQGVNIRMIIVIAEFVIIIGLFIFILRKKG